MTEKARLRIAAACTVAAWSPEASAAASMTLSNVYMSEVPALTPNSATGSSLAPMQSTVQKYECIAIAMGIQIVSAYFNQAIEYLDTLCPCAAKARRRT